MDINISISILSKTLVSGKEKSSQSPSKKVDKAATKRKQAATRKTTGKPKNAS